MAELRDEILKELCHVWAQEMEAAALRCPEEPYTTIQRTKADYWYKRALQLSPGDPEIHYALIYLATERGDYGEAINHCTAAMASKHLEHKIMSHYNRGLLRLMMKDYVGGFEDYDARLEIPLNKKSRIERFGNLPYWKGEPCNILHVSGEQGFGDIFQFLRYVPLIQKHYGVNKVLFEVPKSLNRLIAYNFRRFENIEVVSEAWHPKVDYHIQLVSLARVFGTTYQKVPAPFKIEAEPAYIEKWKDPNPDFKVAFNHTARADDHDMQVTEWNSRREINRDLFHSIFDLTPCIRVPLQPEENPNVKDWSDTAGLLANMNLAVSIDSGPVHLAASMGIPTWLLNHKRSCWRWEIVGEKTVWYGDNLKIFRQQTEGDWSSVLAEAHDEFKKLVEVKEGRQAA